MDEITELLEDHEECHRSEYQQAQQTEWLRQAQADTESVACDLLGKFFDAVRSGKAVTA
jgi:hypothetical protein